MKQYGAFLSIRTIRCALALFGALQASVHAQEPVTLLQNLGPSQEEILPPGAEFFLSPGLGSAIATDGNTALVEEGGYTTPGDPNPNHRGRVAVFSRNSAGLWERSGSIDEPADLTNVPESTLGAVLAVSGDTALVSGAQGLYVFRLRQGIWKRVQTFHLQAGWRFADAAIDRDYAFLAVTGGNQGVVYAYRVTDAGRLHYLQRLDSGVDFDSYARRLSLSGDQLIVSATGDDEGRGAAYVFVRQGKHWKKQQKIVAIDGMSGDSFGGDVAISGDWIAVGAPGVGQARGPDPDCFYNILSGAVYVFRKTNGTWSQQQEMTGEDVRALFPYNCMSTFGEQLVVSDNWIIANSEQAGPAFVEVDSWGLRRDATGQYQLVGLATGTTGGAESLAVTEKTLLVGKPLESGCYYEFCPGDVDVYRLNDPAP